MLRRIGLRRVSVTAVARSSFRDCIRTLPTSHSIPYLRSTYSRLGKPVSGLNASKLSISLTSTRKPLPKLEDLTFGTTFTDHMLVARWDEGAGWSDPKIIAFEPLEISPAALVFHVGLECFEGMKAYRTSSGKILLFRPDQNMARLRKSVDRLAMPAFDDTQLLECIKKLVKVDERWVPERKGYSLYLRPTLIATTPSLSVDPPSSALLFCILSPVGPYYPTGFSAVRVRATFEYTRAFPGGTGENKVGINYAPGMMPQVRAEGEGFQQCLWVWGEERVVTEVGASNFFIFWTNESGEKELVTPSLDDGLILPGVTRASVLHLAQSWNEFKVTERRVCMPELVKAVEEGRVMECFSTGTAAVITPIKAIGYESRELAIPLDPSDPTQGAGPLARRLFDEVVGIQYGEVGGPEGWVVEV
ncbi:branched-chain amino acid aminotransferase II [Gonapodya prolifera JEL478]|uniref:Branched-chain-amino-acid aminotransferase n=1 Tax=Gonapodya prolifera (strain JEL478) TaxID=1344416 RepID=A0A139ADR5_GONPJ|nr:branched-chain amino acid aminotransferase II [Gonapodya prolifera JEL478]|eukprot:KXS14734.1 branched-chain amino acid aminotransferase II [Gonapodya prolifera JEL478]